MVGVMEGEAVGEADGVAVRDVFDPDAEGVADVVGVSDGDDDPVGVADAEGVDDTSSTLRPALAALFNSDWLPREGEETMAEGENAGGSEAFK